MQINEHRIHQIFRVSVILKGLHALVECAGGLLLWVVSSATLVHWVNLATQGELAEDPRDRIATALYHAAQQLSPGAQHFYALYLLLHGVIKVVLVAGLLREKILAYPLSLAALGLFILYQLYRYSFTHAPGLIVLTAFDLFVMVLVWHEWRLLRRHFEARKR